MSPSMSLGFKNIVVYRVYKIDTKLQMWKICQFGLWCSGSTPNTTQFFKFCVTTFGQVMLTYFIGSTF